MQAVVFPVSWCLFLVHTMVSTDGHLNMTYGELFVGHIIVTFALCAIWLIEEQIFLFHFFAFMRAMMAIGYCQWIFPNMIDGLVRAIGLPVYFCLIMVGSFAGMMIQFTYPVTIALVIFWIIVNQKIYQSGSEWHFSGWMLWSVIVPTIGYVGALAGVGYTLHYPHMVSGMMTICIIGLKLQRMFHIYCWWNGISLWFYKRGPTREYNTKMGTYMGLNVACVLD